MDKFEIKRQDGKNPEIKRQDSDLNLKKKGRMVVLAENFIIALKIKKIGARKREKQIQDQLFPKIKRQDDENVHSLPIKIKWLLPKIAHGINFQ